MHASSRQLRTSRASVLVLRRVFHLVGLLILGVLLADGCRFYSFLRSVDCKLGIGCLVRIVGVTPSIPSIICIHLVWLAGSVTMYSRANRWLAVLDHSAYGIALWALFEDCDARLALLPVLVDE